MYFQDIGISEMRLGNFISSMCDFLAVIMEANCETNEVPVFNIETTWSKVKGNSQSVYYISLLCSDLPYCCTSM